MERNRRPPDVEEALSSMLWTPYQRTPSVSSEDDDTDVARTIGKNKEQSQNTNADLFSQSIRYSNDFASNYRHFFPKSYNSCNRQLPSYDHIESERAYHSFTSGCNTNSNNNNNNNNNGINNNDGNTGPISNPNGIYMIPQHSKCSTSMVHSFTDDFIQYHQIQSTTASTSKLGPNMAHTHRSSTPVANRFSNDFSLLDIHLVATSSNKTTQQWKYGNTGDLHSFSQNVYCTASTTTASTATNTSAPPPLPSTTDTFAQYTDTSYASSTRKQLMKNINNNAAAAAVATLADDEDLLPDEQRVTKPHQYHHNIVSFEPIHAYGSEASIPRDTLHSNRVGNDRITTKTTTTTKKTITEPTKLTTTNTETKAETTTTASANVASNQTELSRDRLFHANVSSTAHAFFDFIKFKRNSESNSSVHRNCGSLSNRSGLLSSISGDSVGAMRLNVPAAVTAAVAATDDSISSNCILNGGVSNQNTVNNMIVTSTDGIGTTCSSSQILENGTLMGAIVTQQPSLTIHVNQNDQQQQHQPNFTHQPLSGQQQQQQQQYQDVVNQSAGVSIVNCYRAVPVQIVNSGSDSQNNITNNVRIVNNLNLNNNNNIDHISNQMKINTSVSTKSEKCDIECIDDDDNTRIDVFNNGIQSDFVNNTMDTTANNVNNNITNNNNTSHVQLMSQQQRTFISTEAQTDDLQQQQHAADTALIDSSSCLSPSITATTNTSNNCKPNESNGRRNGAVTAESDALTAREQRRRERRERRQARNARQQHVHPSSQSALVHPHHSNCEILPDILHSHVPPPYTTLPMPTHCQINANPSSILGQSAPLPPPPPPSVLVPGPPSALINSIPVGISDDGRYTFPLPIMRRSPSERSGKGCCGQWFAGPPLRAVIAVVALGGIACALGGAALGATGLAGPPTSHLTAALLMIGVGVILVTVSGAAWRMTAPGAPQCLGLGSGELGRCGRRPCSGRAPHGLLYPEFQHRPPPPTYQASMQEYRLRLLLLDRDRQAGVVRGASPPPTYRSHAGTLLRAPLSVRCNNGNGGPGSEYSLPPSYRARNNLLRIPAIMGGNGNGANNIGHHIVEDTGNAVSPAAMLNDSMTMGTITETRAVITSVNQRHQQMQQQQQQQQQLLLQQQQQQQKQQQQRNSIISDTITSSNDIMGSHNTILAVDDNIVNNTKISQICNAENRPCTITAATTTASTGILPGVLPLLVKSTAPVQHQQQHQHQLSKLTNISSSVASPNVPSKLLSKSTTDIHDIDRLFLNASTHNNTLGGDNDVIMNGNNNIECVSSMANTKMASDSNRKDLVTIVTISGCTTTESSTGEMDILAHL